MINGLSERGQADRRKKSTECMVFRGLFLLAKRELVREWFGICPNYECPNYECPNYECPNYELRIMNYE